MNKLRKGPPGSGPRHNSSSVASSRTLQLAQDVSVSLWPARSSVKELSPPSSRVEFLGPSPTSSSEQYWAARALSAETLLAAREAHHKELKELLHAEELKRARDISTITQEYKEKHTGLEKLVTALLLFLFLLIVLIIYLAAHYTRQQTSRSKPSHFTIPILSPFTSVVEYETSVIGTKTITIALFLTAGVAYLTIRYRLSRVRS